MTSTPWSVKGIDAKARETAKELARRSGMTLGEWLNERIRDEGGSLMEESASTVSRALHDLTGRIENAETRSSVTLSGVDQTVKGVLARLELAEREQTAVAARFEGAVQDQLAVQSAIETRLRALEAQAAGPRSAEALKSLEAALGRVANHLYDGEGRTREQIAQVSARLARIEAAQDEAGAKADLAALSQRLDRAEKSAIERLRALEGSYAEILRRLAAMEQKADPSAEIEEKLDAMAATVARGLQAARSEMARQLSQAIEANGDRTDQALLDLTAHVQRAEQRSAQALEKMGQEVLRVADVLNRRVQGIETRAAGALQNMGGEVARVVDSLEGRLDRADKVQAENWEKMGGEIARVTERLSDRIGAAERRAAQAVDDVQDKLQLAAERLNQRHDRAQGDLAERIRLSEERTQRLLEEARERVDRRLAEAQVTTPPAPAQPRFAEPVSFATDTLQAPAFPSAMAESNASQGLTLYPDAAPFGHSFAPRDFIAVEPEFGEADLDAAHDFATPQTPQSEADFVEAAEQPTLDAQPALEAAAEAVEVEEIADEPLDLDAPAPVLGQQEAPPPPPPVPDSFNPRILTTKELVEQARAAARAASEENRARKTKPSRPSRDVTIIGPLGVGTGRRKRNDNGGRMAMAVTLTGALALVGAGAFTLWKKPLDLGLPGAEEEATPRVAVALDPKPIDTTAPSVATVTPGAPDPAAAALYKEGKARIEAKDNGGVEPLTRAANLGHPAAQYELGVLYEHGGAGLTKNLSEARRWYERAAGRGEARAMHNAALMYYEGVGGPQNLAAAAEWFKQAAELGLADSQFNLGQLYEQGVGLTRNPAEAYKWYLLAAKKGEPAQRAQAATAAERVKAILPPQARATAERVASEFKVGAAAAPGVDVASLQSALGQLGYYKGSANGVSSQALMTAIREFQRDNGLAQTGEADAATAARLAPFMRG